MSRNDMKKVTFEDKQYKRYTKKAGTFKSNTDIISLSNEREE